jgi:DNA-binding SARP family transcriptional activator
MADKMGTGPLTEQRNRVLQLLEKGELQASMEALEEQGLGWFLEMDFDPLITALHSVSSLVVGHQLSDRLSFLLDAMDPGATSTEMLTWYGRFAGQEDFAGAVAALTAGTGMIWNQGAAMGRMAPFHEGCQALLAREGSLGPLARSALYGTLARMELWWKGDVPRFKKTIKEAILLAEQARSKPLRLLFSCTLNQALTVSGDFPLVDVLLTETEPLSEVEDMPAATVMMHGFVRGLLHFMRGEVEESAAILSRVTASPRFDEVPQTLWVMIKGTLLMAVARTGNARETAEMFTIYNARCVPELNYIGTSFSHCCRAVVAILQGQPHRGLLHAQQSMERAGLSESPPMMSLVALVFAQALVDLDRREEALGFLGEWIPSWRAMGFELLASAGAMEACSVLLRAGRPKEALAQYELARTLVADGEPLCVLNRQRGYGERIAASVGQPHEQGSLEPQQPRVDIRTLGGLSVSIDGKPVDRNAWQGRRTKALLKLLVSQSDARVPVEGFLDRMWPDLDGDTALNAFKTTLCRLRKIGSHRGLGGEWIAMYHRKVSLDRSLCRIDYVVFREACAEALREESMEKLARALDMYQDDFLPTDTDVDWIEWQRRRLADEFVAAALKLGRLCLRSSSPEKAIHYLEEATARAPLNENLCGCLMRCHEDCGYHVKALQVYTELEKRIKTEVGTEPSLPLVALARRLKMKTSMHIPSPEHREA